MHSAPAVSYPVGRSRFQGWLLAATGFIGALTGVLWHYQTHAVGWRQGLFFAILLGACGLAVWAWRRTPRGLLRWDGQAWRWSCLDVSTGGVLSVHFDFQYFLLLKLSTEAGARIWLWPERRTDLTRWSDLRRAVFSRRGAAQSLAAEAAAAQAQVSL